MKADYTFEDLREKTEEGDGTIIGRR